MDANKLKQAYNKLAKKYTLPAWQALDDEFEIIETKEGIDIIHTLRFIRRRMTDKFSNYALILEGILQPNPGSLISLQEPKFFTEEQLQVIITLLKEFMCLERQSLLLDTASTEKLDAVYIKQSFDLWKSLKKDLLVVTTTLAEGWKKERKNDNFSYMG
ncbi:MAG: hypothetical protein Q7R96_00065 [Nanoarchaeota archaeon]|nr:hypothetical protein [Nanoarchaeota archaeon]